MSEYLTLEERVTVLTDRKNKDRYQNRNRRSFLRVSAISIAGVRDILELCTSEMSFNILCKKSRIAHKMTFLKYVNWCVDHGMIEKESRKHKMIYLITPKGRRFLQDVADNDDDDENSEQDR